MPEQASEFAPHYDWAFLAITALTIFFTVVVMAVIVFFAVRYRQHSKADRSNPVSGHTMLEITWSVIPLLLALVIFAWNAELFVQTRIPPKDSMEIFVIGKQWMWHLQHPSGVRENNTLTVPVNTNIKLTMISQDVIHSFYVPQFRIKQDVLPGRYTSQWFKATKIGKYNLFCTEYCGTQHSEMGGYVYVVSQADYANWVARKGDSHAAFKSPAEAGKDLWDRLRCGTCHGPEDTDRGPTLHGILGMTLKMADGSSRLVDAGFIRESIVDPYKAIHAGYDNSMAAYSELTENELLQLYEYIKTLGAKGSASTETSGETTR